MYLLKQLRIMKGETTEDNEGGIPMTYTIKTKDIFMHLPSMNTVTTYMI
jgi:hypothetical protein